MNMQGYTQTLADNLANNSNTAQNETLFTNFNCQQLPFFEAQLLHFTSAVQHDFVGKNIVIDYERENNSSPKLISKHIDHPSQYIKFYKQLFAEIQQILLDKNNKLILFDKDTLKKLRKEQPRYFANTYDSNNTLVVLLTECCIRSLHTSACEKRLLQRTNFTVAFLINTVTRELRQDVNINTKKTLQERVLSKLSLKVHAIP